MAASRLEPWLRKTHAELRAPQRAVIHALEQAQEDLDRWCSGFTADQLNASPHGLPSLGFQLLHIGRSLDRLLTYAEGNALTEIQLAVLAAEHNPVEDADAPLAEAKKSLRRTRTRILKTLRTSLEAPRYVGRTKIPTTLGGLLVHMAEHTQRHVGQAITTAKVLKNQAESREAK